MRYLPIVSILAVGLMIGLSGCGETKEYLGIGQKRAPDEFTVYTREPLSLPPDYGLRPPTPGSKPDKTSDPRKTARDILIATTGQLAVSGGRTLDDGTKAFLRRAGALNADPEIRHVIDQETAMLASKGPEFTEQVLFWQKKEPYGAVVNPVEESKRIKEAQSLGESLTETETPIIERKPKAWLEGIFN